MRLLILATLSATLLVGYASPVQAQPAGTPDRLREADLVDAIMDRAVGDFDTITRTLDRQDRLHCRDS